MNLWMLRAMARRTLTAWSASVGEGARFVSASPALLAPARTLVVSVSASGAAGGVVGVPVRVLSALARLVLIVAVGITLATTLTMNWSIWSSPSCLRRPLAILMATASIGMIASTVA